MSKIKIIDLEGKVVSQTEFDPKLKISKPHKQALFDVVIAEDASKHQGTHSTLTKGEVRGGGKKPLPQKHTGNARQGSIRNPHYVGGGVAFGPKPGRNYKHKVNTKVNSLAFRSAFEIKEKNEMIFGLIDEIKINKPSTRKIIKLIKNLKIEDKKILFVLNDEQEKLIASITNIEKIVVKKWNQISTKDILNSQIIIIQVNAIKKLAEAQK